MGRQALVCRDMSVTDRADANVNGPTHSFRGDDGRSDFQTRRRLNVAGVDDQKTGWEQGAHGPREDCQGGG